MNKLWGREVDEEYVSESLGFDDVDSFRRWKMLKSDTEKMNAIIELQDKVKELEEKIEGILGYKRNGVSTK